MQMCLYVCVHVYICVCVCVCVLIYGHCDWLCDKLLPLQYTRSLFECVNADVNLNKGQHESYTHPHSQTHTRAALRACFVHTLYVWRCLVTNVGAFYLRFHLIDFDSDIFKFKSLARNQQRAAFAHVGHSFHGQHVK